MLQPPGGVATMMVLPTLLLHGSPDLVGRLVPPLLDGSHHWCQLFSEPVAGSDLAGLQTRAERDGAEWVVNGQKVWTSFGQFSDYGMLIARTDSSQPKRRGITCFVCPMRQPGVDVRPLREMTGRAMFNEVFLSDARVPEANVIGDLNAGWSVAASTLAFERAGIGGADASVLGDAVAGSVAGHLDQPAGSFVGRGALGEGAGPIDPLLLAATAGKAADPVTRQALARLHGVQRINSWHLAAVMADTTGAGGHANLAKLRMGLLSAMNRDVVAAIAGPAATAVPDGGDRSVLDTIVGSPAASIYGGTDQIQRNIIGERVLGLPREPGPPPDTPFRDLPRNC
jgi:alkylation response protein AidB-like acyl-CoA dehydrogenase